MNAVEIEEAISQLAEHPFDAATFPYAFLEAFGNKETTIKRLKTPAGNKSDINGAVLQPNNIHISTCATGEVTNTLIKLKSSPATTKQKAKFILATDGNEFQAEDVASGDTVVCDYADFPNHFGFFLPLAGISTVKQISENAFDIRATSRLNKLYITLLQDNPEWGTEERRPEMNHFMARLIFCFFAEDTGIFSGTSLFTGTVEKMSAKDSSNTHEVISEIFRAMNTHKDRRANAKLPRWADGFPYVNGGLFSGSADVPIFSKIARSYLIHVGHLDWTKINPDIFGSMIQAVADDTERGALGMHYTSVPNILKVLNPLFLDDLREQLNAADTPIKLLNLRKRMARIRVFDPACGSGNFLVIAYKQMREIEAEINKRRDEQDRPSDIPLTNFRGIELRDFPAEIARLALIIAEYQCNVLYRGSMAALDVFLPLKKENWITCENALRIDWLSVCPPTGKAVKLQGDDLFSTPLDQAQIDFENEGGETYICGNPPYIGDKKQDTEQKNDIQKLLSSQTSRWKSFDYICGFFWKAAQYISVVKGSSAAFVSTNSICQGVQASQFWQVTQDLCGITFAHTSFKWANLAAHNAGVTCVIIGLGEKNQKIKRIFSSDSVRDVESISPYLTAGRDVFVVEAREPLSELHEMLLGNVPKDGGNLLFSEDEARNQAPEVKKYLFPIFGSQEFIKGFRRFCLWITESQSDDAQKIPVIRERLNAVAKMRLESTKGPTRDWAKKPYRFVEIRSPSYQDVMIVPRVSSESRDYLPIGFLSRGSVVLDSAFALYDAPLWNMALIASRLHLVWIATVCGKLKTDFRYSNTLGWNTFPVPILTEKNKADLTRCAEDILLAREAHFPATIADLYDPDKMPENLRHAHERNDEVLERIYIGRRFKNDTERLEKLFDLYTKMVSEQKKPPSKRKASS
ncbi:MAG: class I SAM-dependent DNA methyltransferase [Alphaproteobacteria bacterium]|nr:class I SAM-dependent DNA methyltransferase [Alphaproteobacteria bacterium]